MSYTNYVKSAMKLKGINQKDMAELLDIDLSSFNNKLNRKISKCSGKPFVFSIDEAVSICEILDVSLNDIFLPKEVAKRCVNT